MILNLVSMAYTTFNLRVTRQMMSMGQIRYVRCLIDEANIGQIQTEN